MTRSKFSSCRDNSRLIRLRPILEMRSSLRRRRFSSSCVRTTRKTAATSLQPLWIEPQSRYRGQSSASMPHSVNNWIRRGYRRPMVLPHSQIWVRSFITNRGLGIKSAQDSATSTIQIVVQSASVATSSAFSSVRIANLAVTSANAALTSATNALNTANLAVTSANSALDSATQALTTANFALTSALSASNSEVLRLSSSSSSDVFRLSSASSSEVARLSASLSLAEASLAAVRVRTSTGTLAIEARATNDGTIGWFSYFQQSPRSTHFCAELECSTDCRNRGGRRGRVHPLGCCRWVLDHSNEKIAAQ